MDATGQSLRTLVDKWLAPNAGVPARVVRFSRMQGNRLRYVCIETAHPARTIAIFFSSRRRFLVRVSACRPRSHDDGACGLSCVARESNAYTKYKK